MLVCGVSSFCVAARPSDNWVHTIPKTKVLDHSKEPDATFLREMAALLTTARTVSMTTNYTLHLL